jgi:hypothetical protein
MATLPVQSSNPIQELAAKITKKLDVDGDGNLSSVEFSGFLTQFLGALQTQQAGGNSKTLTDVLNAAAGTGTGATADRKPVGTMAGYDMGKLANLSHDSSKYRIGRILQYYPNTPQGLRDALPEIQQIIPSAKITGGNGDKLDFGTYVDSRGFTLGVIDVLVAGGAGGRAWQWAPVS